MNGMTLFVTGSVVLSNAIKAARFLNAGNTPGALQAIVTALFFIGTAMCVSSLFQLFRPKESTNSAVPRRP